MSAGHNYELTKIRQQIRCNNCGKKARTISQPNDKHRLSRVVQYRVVCDRCKKSYLVEEAYDYADYADGAIPYE